MQAVEQESRPAFKAVPFALVQRQQLAPPDETAGHPIRFAHPNEVLSAAAQVDGGHQPDMHSADRRPVVVEDALKRDRRARLQADLLQEFASEALPDEVVPFHSAIYGIYVAAHAHGAQPVEALFPAAAAAREEEDLAVAVQHCVGDDLLQRRVLFGRRPLNEKPVAADGLDVGLGAGHEPMRRALGKEILARNYEDLLDRDHVWGD